MPPGQPINPRTTFHSEVLHPSRRCVRILGQLAGRVWRARLRFLMANKSRIDFLCSLEKARTGEQMKHHQPFIRTLGLRIVLNSGMMALLFRD